MFWLLLISIFFVILIIIYAGIPWAEQKVLFFPSKKTRWKPKSHYDDIYIDVQDPSNSKRKYMKNYIHGWHFNNFPNHKTVLFCHGNSGNISHRKYILDICRRFELNLFIFDYRGFGKSSGNPAKKNLKIDGKRAYKYLTDRCGIKGKDIIVWGESLGGFPAVSIASNYPCRSLILLSTFSGLDDTAINCFNGVGKSIVSGVASLASLRFDMLPNRDYIKKVKCPVVIMHSIDDNIISYKCSQILYKNISHKSKVLIPIRGTHSAPIIKKEDLNKLFMFCDISLPIYDYNIKKILKNIETAAEKYHLVDTI